MLARHKQRLLALADACRMEIRRLGDGPERNVSWEKVKRQIGEARKLALGGSLSIRQSLERMASFLEDAAKSSVGNEECSREMDRVRKAIEREKATSKFEVVFFPYKVSMSDSMQTIYLAAKKDPECEAYWCPIPYYDKNADFSLGAMHYECDGYGDAFEITGWDSYDAEVRHPDIIFTHYAYDAYNYVTTIHPAYYSDRLKNFTDLLMYVDYGITMKVPRRIGNAQKLWENEAFIPAYWNADYVVAYSKEFAKVVEFHMKSVGKLDDEATKMVASKIVPMGSAKFDMVLRAQRECFAMPQEWIERIGTRKVLLYNTSLHGLLKESDVFLQEIIEVIEATLKNDDIVLWWRPHPLMENTLHSMRPELSWGVHEIARNFKEQHWGIYDDTDDLYRAISWSDACLTNESSLVWLYLASGKPFAILDSGWRLKSPQTDDGTDFCAPLRCRINNMKAGNGANPKPDKWNVCVWWQNFSTEDVLHNIHYHHFLDRFLHFVVHREEYPEADEYKKLQLQIFHDFVANSDGTAGEKIYAFSKHRLLVKVSR